MGAFSPSPLLDDAMQAVVMADIIDPVLHGMRAEGTEYRGFLYAGLMMTCAGPRVIEYNVRFGDPEAQAVLPLVSGELLPLLVAAADGDLGNRRVQLSSSVSVGVVLASAGYPGRVTSGVPIAGLDEASQLPGVTVFHSGTAVADGRIVTAGGRVLTVVGTGHDYKEAIARAYQGVGKIYFEGMQYRRDIGAKALRNL
jgi:phosphoribosylamine--glycine ligase